MTIKLDDAYVMAFAQDLLKEYEGKGYKGGTLFLALMQLIAQNSPDAAFHAAMVMDKVVMEAQRVRQCKTPL
jgi:hypothetical protein